nr:PREDICTED: disintegrin and metalloproteinase domain-containing protein 20-like [Anolis carolinensis]|eukprot:XP_016851913.1 PREDICTED: disintegrin and metalloproteinase domain-containing protein 20-like [Anolis carolinensis]
MRQQRMNFMGLLPLSGKTANALSWLLMIFLRNFLTETAGQTPPRGFRYASYEVTIPRKLTPRYGQRQHRDATYFLQIEGESYFLYLRQKRGLVPKHFPVFTYKEEGDLQVDHPFIRDNCFYHGVVQGKPSSLVTLSTCLGGLRGILRLKNETYEIEPVPASDTFQHVVYRLEEEEEEAIHMMCGLTEEEQKHQEAMMWNRENGVAEHDFNKNWWTHTRYVKVAVVVEHERFVKFDKNETLTTLHILNVIHTANSLYDPLPLRLSLAGLEIWSTKNLIEIADTINDTLLSFTRWRRDSLVQRLQNDAGHLFVYKSPPDSEKKDKIKYCGNKVVEKVVLLDNAVPTASISKLDPFAEKKLASVTFLSTAVELQYGVLKMFMYKMVPHAMTIHFVIMESAALIKNNVK